jgi:hypothetical protein
MKILNILLTLFLQFYAISAVLGQEKHFIEEYTYTAGDRDSKDICYDIAKTRLRATLLDKIGVYIKTETLFKTFENNGKYNQNFVENISSVSAGITKFEVIDQSWNGTTYWMKAKITIDTTALGALIVNEKKTNELDDLKKQINRISDELDVVKSSKNINEKSLYVKSLNKQSITAGTNDQFNDLKLSKENNLLFLSTTNGRMIVLDQNDSVLKTFRFSNLGHVSLDYVGDVGAFIDNRSVIYFFNQKTLKMIDTIRVTTKDDEGAFKVWFTRTRILISSFKNIYEYKSNNSVVELIHSYSILDYSYSTNQVLLGHWNESLKFDRKIVELFLEDAASLSKRTTLSNVLNIDKSFELYSYITDNGSNVISYDGKGNYYTVNIFTGEKKVTLQGNIINASEKIYGLTKIDDDMVLVVKYNPNEFIFKNPKTGHIVKSVKITQIAYDNQTLINNTTKTIYYLTIGDNNKLISIK